MSRRFKLVARGTALLLLLAPTFALTARAWQSGTAPRSGVDRILAERARVINNRRIEEGLRKPAGRGEPQLAVAQIKEDYVQIQVVGGDLMRAAPQGGALDLKLVAKSAAEIRKRAERLKHNLALPEPEETAARPATDAGDDEARLRASVSTLGKLIAGFVRNPIFRQVGVVNARAAATARRELEEIIGLSGRLKKESEKLSKAAQKSH